MTTCTDFNAQILVPALAFIRANLKAIPASVEEHTMLLAIAGQEGAWTYRQQMPNDYANSFWQFERGGILGLMRDDETSKQVAMLCGLAGIQFQSTAIWRFMGTQPADNFSAAMARLLLWTDPAALPNTEDAGWSCYLRLWRPGAPDRNRWHSYYQNAFFEAAKAASVIAQGVHV